MFLLYLVPLFSLAFCGPVPASEGPTVSATVLQPIPEAPTVSGSTEPPTVLPTGPVIAPIASSSPVLAVEPESAISLTTPTVPSTTVTSAVPLSGPTDTLAVPLGGATETISVPLAGPTETPAVPTTPMLPSTTAQLPVASALESGRPELLTNRVVEDALEHIQSDVLSSHPITTTTDAATHLSSLEEEIKYLKQSYARARADIDHWVEEPRHRTVVLPILVGMGSAVLTIALMFCARCFCIRCTRCCSRSQLAKVTRESQGDRSKMLNEPEDSDNDTL